MTLFAACRHQIDGDYEDAFNVLAEGYWKTIDTYAKMEYMNRIHHIISKIQKT